MKLRSSRQIRDDTVQAIARIVSKDDTETKFFLRLVPSLKSFYILESLKFVWGVFFSERTGGTQGYMPFRKQQQSQLIASYAFNSKTELKV